MIETINIKVVGDSFSFGRIIQRQLLILHSFTAVITEEVLKERLDNSHISVHIVKLQWWKIKRGQVTVIRAALRSLTAWNKKRFFYWDTADKICVRVDLVWCENNAGFKEKPTDFKAGITLQSEGPAVFSHCFNNTIKEEVFTLVSKLTALLRICQVVNTNSYYLIFLLLHLYRI